MDDMIMVAENTFTNVAEGKQKTNHQEFDE